MFTVTNPGLLTTIQDEGRWGYQAYGMPVAGAMDRYAYRVANLLAGNKDGAAVIEMTLMGAAFRFDTDLLIAVCGADMQAALDGVSVTNWSSFWVKRGSELTFGYVRTGCRAYLAVHGGINVPDVLGSRSTYTRAKVGGLQGRALLAGDTLAAGQDKTGAPRPRMLQPTCIPSQNPNIDLRVLLGPQDTMFAPEAIATFFRSPYTVTDEADRMGYRLEGEKIAHTGKADIISDALCLGAIQIPAHGMPIIMMADRQTTGGYAKIGTVIGPDLRKLAQAKPGDAVRFRQVMEEAAVEALRLERQTYLEIAASFREDVAAVPVPSAGRVFRVAVNGAAYRVEIEEVL
ncbi:biotin-dependent carboxyltransferase family protein [Acetonema longum]|uniref:Urea amidolyase related protein n=1 Tax=Acetonema longum DSM 6540 TaxID=1009370 RepID=F7NG31_9FIRM|nr:biotin-dependent carboxyltransferase family protein [Acetonema longum]EGO64949.1 urea amidolyase related protein [Acetonema longum DSM 6540]